MKASSRQFLLPSVPHTIGVGGGAAALFFPSKLSKWRCRCSLQATQTCVLVCKGSRQQLSTQQGLEDVLAHM